MRHLLGIAIVLLIVVGFSTPASAVTAFTLSPGSINLQVNPGSSPSSTPATVTNQTTSSLSLQVSATTSNGGNWLSVSTSNLSIGAGVGKTGGFTVTISPQNLQAGPYSGTVTVSGNGTTQTISVSLSISGVALVVSPNSVSDTIVAGKMGPTHTIKLVDPQSNQPVNVNANIQSNQPYVAISNFTGTQFQITVDATTLKAGFPYSAVVTVQSSGGSPFLPASVGVSITITAPPPPATPIASPSSLTFSAIQGQFGNPTPQSINVTTSDGSSQTVNVTNKPSFVSVTPASGTASAAPATFSVTVNASALKPGSNTGSITFTLVSGGTTTVGVSASLNTPPTLSAVPTSLSFQTSSGLSLPPPQTVTVTSSDQSLQSFGFTFTPQGSWLKVTANQSITTATLTASIVSLPPQNSTGSITITPADGAAVITIPVSLAVPANQPVIPTGGVIFASSYGAFTTITSGGFVEIYGSNLAPGTADWGSSFKNGVAPTSLSGVTVQIDGKPAFVNFVSTGQVNVLAPDNLSVGGTVNLVLSNANGTSLPVAVKSAALEPGLLAPANFKINGTQYVTAFLPDGNYALPTGAIGNSRPAKPGEVVVMYGLGFGPVNPPLATGTLETVQNTLQNPLQVLIGGVSAALPYDGLAPGYAGLYQFNVTIPSVPDNNSVPLTFNLGGVPGGQTLFIAVHQ
jgi:uncharacterized protein (TIGR03437 family)